MLFINGKKCVKRFNEEICFACQGYAEPLLICSRKSCSLAGQPQTRFELSSGNNQGIKSTPYCYTCMEECIGIKRRPRFVPPRYFKYFGIKEKSSSVTTTTIIKADAVDRRVDISSIWDEGQIVGIEKIDTICIGTEVPIEEYIHLAKRLGLLTNTNEVQIILRELSNILCMMIDNCSGLHWKDTIPSVMAGHHKQSQIMIPNSTLFRVSQPQEAITAPESPEESGTMVESKQKSCVMM
jgi:hypothetical protein